MPKFTPVILPDAKPNYDGTFDVKVRIGHKSKSAYLDTGQVVPKKEISKGKIKPMWIVENLSNLLKGITETIKNIEYKLDAMTASDIKTYIENSKKKASVSVSDIDFKILFSEHIHKLKEQDKYYKTFQTAFNALNDYIGNDMLLATDINVSFLVGFETFLKGERKITRLNQGVQRTFTSKSEKGASVRNILRDFRTVFNAARFKHNDEDAGVILIPNNPYKKYKLPEIKSVGSHRALTIEEIRTVWSVKVEPNSRPELAQELSKLSFMLCGINAADLYKLKPTKGKRVEYNRSKTEYRRKDNAFISIKLIDEAIPLYQKYIGQLNKRYSSEASLNRGIKSGMDALIKLTGIDGLQFYSFRHSFASIARNECRFSKDDIAMAMNHVDSANRVTDIYIKKDWSIVDDVQRGVVDAVLGKEEQ